MTKETVSCCLAFMPLCLQCSIEERGGPQARLTTKARPVDGQLGFRSPRLGVCADGLSLSPVPKSRVPTCTPVVPLFLPSVPPGLLLKHSRLCCQEKGGISPQNGVGRVPHERGCSAQSSPCAEVTSTGLPHGLGATHPVCPQRRAGPALWRVTVPAVSDSVALLTPLDWSVSHRNHLWVASHWEAYRSLQYVIAKNALISAIH